MKTMTNSREEAPEHTITVTPGKFTDDASPPKGYVLCSYGRLTVEEFNERMRIEAAAIRAAESKT